MNKEFDTKNSSDSNENNVVIHSTYEYELIINGTQGYILWGIVFVFIAFLGCIGNIITIIVLKRDPIMTTLNILLIALAISDILAPTANVLLAISFYHLSNTYGDSVNFMIFNDILRNIIQPLSTMFTMSSSWIVTTTTLFRLIAVMWPFKARTLINKRFALVSLLIIFGFGLASIVPLYASLTRRVKCTRDGKSQYKAFELEITSEFMAKAYIPMIQTMCFYLPWLIALTLWLFLLRSLRRSEKNFNISFVAKENSTIVTTPFLNLNSTNNNSKNNLNANGSYVFNNNSIKSAKRNSLNNNNDFSDNNSIRNMNNVNVVQNPDSRVNNIQTRLRSYNRITLMVVVLTFTNLICRVFTFVFIFEVIFNEYLKRTYFYNYEEINDSSNNNSNNKTLNSSAVAGSNDELMNNNFNATILNARYHFPRFLSYSLLLNNIFLCINHSCNIVIYTFTNPRFKKNLFSLFESIFFSKAISRTINNSRKSYKSNQNNSILNDDYYILNSPNDDRNYSKFSKIFRCFCKYNKNNDTSIIRRPLQTNKSNKLKGSNKSISYDKYAPHNYIKRSPSPFRV